MLIKSKKQLVLSALAKQALSKTLSMIALSVIGAIAISYLKEDSLATYLVIGFITAIVIIRDRKKRIY